MLEMKMAYCDYIADVVQRSLYKDASENTYSKLGGVGKVKLDLDPTMGNFKSTKKSVEVFDCHGKKYLVTIEEK